MSSILQREHPVKITLRETTAADQDFVMSVYDSTRDDLDVVGWDSIQRAAFIRMQFTAQNAQYRETYPRADSQIILVEGNPAGRMLVDRSGQEIVLVEIAIMPPHRNGGIGTQLVRELIDEARGLGKTVRLHVLARSAAVRLYERLGFAKTDDDGTYLEMRWAAPREVPVDLTR
jgi:ribosomal protein S18 acetylase RimI-like enzyme